METLLVTFGGGGLRWRAAAARLGRQARQTSWFNVALVVTDRNLGSFLPSFFDSHGELVAREPRGFGFWLWRPLLLAELLAVPHDRIVVFVDAGCELSHTAESDAVMRDYLVEAADRGATLFEVEGDWSDRMYSKRDLTHHVGLGEADLASRQIQGGALILRNSGPTRQLVSAWSALAVAQDYHFLDDSPSRLPEDPAFIEHRHDQSILSTLAKDAGLQSRDNETFHYPDWQGASRYPIWTARNRRVRSLQDGGLVARLERGVIGAYHKAKRWR